MARPRARLAGLDWLLLVASLALGGIAGYLGLLLGMRLLLEPRIVSETALRLSKYTVLVEQVLQHAEEPLPAGVLVRQQNQLPSGTPAQAGRFERLVEEAMAREFGLQRRLQRDQPPLQDPWGGHWVQLNRFDQRTGQTLWLFQSQLLSNSLWYLPPLRILAIVIGALAGLVLFLRLKVERPLGQLLTLLAEQGSAAPLQLLPEQGIAPIRNLSLRINRLLERINNTASARRQLLHGLTHDLGGPHARLMLRTEILCERLSGENGELAQAMALDLERLRELTDQLALLGEQELPAERRQPCALDDLCGRIVASHPSLLIKLRLPGLLVNLDPEGVQRALNNLIDNALEYGAPPVELSAVRRGIDLQSRVDDHGAGIPTESLLEILGPSRSNDANARGIGGWLTGLLRAPCWPENGPGPWPELGWP